MIYNYIIIAWRNLIKQRGLAAINVFGLSIGLACFLLFLLYTVNEFSFDRFHKDQKNIFRVYRWSEDIAGRGAGGDPYLPMPLAPAMKADFPDVEDAVRWREAWGESFVRVNGKVSRIGLSIADPSVFQFFSFPLKFGDAETALKDPRNVVLTVENALRLFGETNPIGKAIEIKVEETFEPFTVSAVAENIPSNSSLRFDIMGSFEFYAGTQHGQSSANRWTRSFLPTFVRLRPGSGLASNPEALLQFRRKYYPDEEREYREKGYWKGVGAPVTYRLQPLRDMHTDTWVEGGEVPPVEPRSIWTLLVIAAGVLLIACINFTTLSIGRSAGRAREVGVRKVMGSARQQLVGQFLTEAMIMAAISGGIGLLLVWILLPYFNQMADRELVFSLQLYPEFGWMIFFVVLFAGFLAGSYPALVLSGFNPLEVLKRNIRLGGSNIFTKSLVTAQFAISGALIISTGIILQQLHFMRSQNPGFDKENVVIVDADETDSKTIFPRFKQLAQAIPQVKGIAGAELGLGEGMGWSRSGWDHNGKHWEVFEYFVDPGYLPVMNLELISGRNFDPALIVDTITSVIINETMMKEFGWTPETAISQTLNGYYENPETPLPRVIGVVKDFHFRPFREEVRAQMFHQFSDYTPFKYFVRIEAGDPSSALSALKKAWESSEPELPFRYNFLDENLDRFYKSEARLGNIIGWAGGISVFLACLGLLGIAALTAVNRQKEIGIRKVLGASVFSMVGLLSRDFLKLVLIAMIFASPVAYFLMKNWLQDFAYSITIGWWIFVMTGFIVAMVAFFTISIQAIKAAMSNPVKSLRSE